MLRLIYLILHQVYFLNTFLAVISVLLVGLGSGIYLIANLGPGPRDGLMTGLTKITNLPIALVRAFLEISVVIIGWYLGGTVGMGTVIFAFRNRTGCCFLDYFLLIKLLRLLKQLFLFFFFRGDPK